MKIEETLSLHRNAFSEKTVRSKQLSRLHNISNIVSAIKLSRYSTSFNIQKLLQSENICCLLCNLYANTERNI